MPLCLQCALHAARLTPRVLTEAMARGGDVAKRAFEAMMQMRKIDVAKIKAAARGKA